MAFEITKQELLRQANELLKKYNKSKDSDLKAQENRLRRIVSDLDSIGSLSSGVTSFNTRTGAVTLTSSDVITALGYTPSSGTPTLDQVTTAGNTTANGITVGNIIVNSSTNELKIFDVTGGNYTRIKNRTISFSRNSGTSESVSIYSPDNQLWLTARSGIYVYSGVNPGETYFFARDYSGTNRIQVKDTGAVILQESNNNVLIGTTTDAGYKLDISGNTRTTGSLNVGSSYGTFLAGATTDWAYTITGGESAVIAAANIQGSTRTIYGVTIPAQSANLVLGTTYGYDWGMSFNIISTGKLGIKVNKSTDAALIFANGNVGIGTTTDAGYKLDVNGTLRTASTISVDGNNGTGGQIFLKNSAGDYTTQIGTSSYDLYLQTRGTGNVIKFRFGSSARELRFQGGGTGDIQVIGEGASWAASGIRDIRHGSDAITITSSNYNGGDGVVIDRGRSTVSTDPIISFKDYGVEKARINRAGNVGIGTTTPFGKLDVKDGEIFVTTSTDANLRSRLTYQGLYVSRSSDGTYPEQIISANSAWEYHTRNNHVFYRDGSPYFQIGTTGAAAYLTLNTTGNFLIGTTTDNGYKLNVNGDATINGVRVGLGGGSVSSNTVVGNGSLALNTTGDNLIAIGSALVKNTTGVQNIGIGNLSLRENTIGSYNTAVGYWAGFGVSTGSYNTMLGRYAGSGIGTGSSNIAIGMNSLYNSATTPNNNISIGTTAMQNASGDNNIAIGTAVLYNNTASNNTAVGHEAAYSNISGTRVTAIGYTAARSSTGGSVTAVGFEANKNNTTGTGIVAVGSRALLFGYGNANTAIGEESLTNVGGGANNTAVGYHSLRSLSTGSGNVALGYQAGYNETGSDKLYIGNSSTNTLIYGNFSTGNVSIGSTVDAGYKLDVSGSARFTQGITVDYNGARIGGVLLALSSQGGGTISCANSAGNNTGSFITLSGPAYLNPTAGNSGMFSITGLYYASSGTATFNHLNLSPTINNSGTYSGIVRGFYYNPTLTSLTGTDHRAIETTVGNVIFSNAELSVSDTGTSGVTHNLLFRNDNNAYGGISISSTGQSLAIQQGGGYGYLTAAGFYIGSANGEIWTNNGSVFRVVDAAGTTNYFRIHDTTGNVSINSSTDAGYKLDVNGTGRVQTNLNVGDTAFTATTPNYISLGGTYATSGYGAKLKLLDSGATQWGIGVSTAGLNYYGTTHNFFAGSTTSAIILSPSADTASTSPAYIAIGQSYSSVAGANPKLRLFGTTYGFGVSAGQVDYIAPTHVFYANGSEAMRITSTGNVGIGTTAPAGPLHVKYSSSTLAGITIENDGVGFNAGSMTLRSGTTGGVNMSVTSGGGLYWYNLNTFSNSLSLPSTGNLIVGGAVDAGYRLDVKGGDARFEQNVEAATYSVAGNAGYSGIVNFPSNPPGSQNLEFLHGILINVF